MVRERIDAFRGAKVGLVTNSTGVDEKLRDNISILIEQGVKVELIFSPEHGLYQTGSPGESIGNSHEPRYGIPVISLYGPLRKPEIGMLSDLDLLIYDIQDVGARFFTYISTTFLCMESAAEAGIPFILLDRPNPITGTIIEGPILEQRLISFVGMHHVPIRYGLTPGELAKLYREDRGLEVNLKVIPMRGWRRDMWFDETGLQWVMPSPNMPTPTTAILYPGTCLFEGTNLSEGRGTTKPFELFGAPWIDPYLLTDETPEPEGAVLRPCFFKPAFSKYKGDLCGGAQIHIIDRRRFRPVRTVLRLLLTIKRLYPDKLVLNVHFDRLCGTESARRAIERGDGVEIERLIERWKGECEAFRSRIEPILLYP